MNAKRIMGYLTRMSISGLIGAGMGLLFAPQSGEETRAQLREKGAELADRTKETYSQISDRVGTTVSHVGERVGDTVSDLRHTVGGKVSGIQSRVGDTVSDIRSRVSDATMSRKEKERAMGLRKTMTYIRGFLIGGIVGAGTALLFAPQSGAKTREQLREKGAELADKAQGAYTDVKSKVTNVVSEAEQKAEQARQKVEQSTTRNEPYMGGTTHS